MFPRGESSWPRPLIFNRILEEVDHEDLEEAFRGTDGYLVPRRACGNRGHGDGQIASQEEGYRHYSHVNDENQKSAG